MKYLVKIYYLAPLISVKKKKRKERRRKNPEYKKDEIKTVLFLV